jgi:2-succinyl-5-enolpyruvyl-6-hydroxy-3-cyclohexene-1-carboxylate synthase
MYSNKENVNILTALLVEYGVRHAVVCPGSRNSPIVHNLNECPDITCYPVTDERSAGFYALGMALCEAEPVAVCVTSGTALLNLAPAVAEAYYQHVPLVVISADRPPHWIDQLDGQTLPQPDALGRFVARSVSLPEVSDLESHWYCNRLINEALLEATGRCERPVHINVPLSEPLFQFDVEELPDEGTTIRRCGIIDLWDIDNSGLRADFWDAKRPMIVIGQNRETILKDGQIQHLMKHAVVLYEPLGSDIGTTHFDEVLYAMGDDEGLLPDFVLYGGQVVSKRLKQFLRKATHADFWELSLDGQLHDTFMRTKGVLESGFSNVLMWLDAAVSDTKTWEDYLDKEFGELPDTSEFVNRWQKELDKVSQVAETMEPPYSQMAVIKHFEQQMNQSDIQAIMHYANSTAVRLACIYSTSYVFCNRGVNGIDGSLSTAAGFSCMTDYQVFCVIGDLSFFYDQNALWNQNLRGNFRILLLNNGKGGIFNMLKGLEQSPVRDTFVAGQHQTTAEGICQQNRVGYQKAVDMPSMQQGIDWLLTTESSRPLLLEVFTDAAEDERVYRDYYRSLSI